MKDTFPDCFVKLAIAVLLCVISLTLLNSNGYHSVSLDINLELPAELNAKLTEYLDASKKAAEAYSKAQEQDNGYSYKAWPPTIPEIPAKPADDGSEGEELFDPQRGAPVIPFRLPEQEPESKPEVLPWPPKKPMQSAEKTGPTSTFLVLVFPPGTRSLQRFY